MATLHIQTSFFPLAIFLYGVSPTIQINDVIHKCGWGWASFELPPGTYELDVSFPYFKATTGLASTTVTITDPDAVVAYAYSAPLLINMAGKLVERQQGAPAGVPLLPGATPHQPAEAPHGIHPRTGLALSHRSKIVAALLQIFLGAFGAGRFYTGHTKVALAQIGFNVISCGGGMIWPLFDGVMLLLGEHTDAEHRPLK